MECFLSIVIHKYIQILVRMGYARHKVGLVLHSSFIIPFCCVSVADELAVEATPVRLQLLDKATRLHRWKRQIVSGWLDITLVGPRYALIAVGKGMDKVGRCCAGVSITDSHIFNIGLITVVGAF